MPISFHSAVSWRRGCAAPPLLTAPCSCCCVSFNEVCPTATCTICPSHPLFPYCCKPCNRLRRRRRRTRMRFPSAGAVALQLCCPWQCEAAAPGGQLGLAAWGGPPWAASGQQCGAVRQGGRRRAHQCSALRDAAVAKRDARQVMQEPQGGLLAEGPACARPPPAGTAAAAMHGGGRMQLAERRGPAAVCAPLPPDRSSRRLCGSPRGWC